MLSHKKMLRNFLIILPLLSLAAPSYGYIDLAPTLSKIITQSTSITLVEVVDYDRDTHTLVLKEVQALKGSAGTATLKHEIATSDGSTKAIVPRPILQWAGKGAQAVLFSSRATALVCIGNGWYQVKLDNEQWKLSADRPDLPLAYYGPVSRLTEAVIQMIAGKDAVITTVPHGAQEAASFELALNRQGLPGLVRLQRLRANLAMPSSVMAVATNPAYLLGQGIVDEQDIPDLIITLASPDATVRAEAAEALRSLGRKAKEATPALSKLLTDAIPRVRLHAAAALLCIAPKDTQPLTLLAQGLTSKDATVRRDAATAIGVSGEAVKSLTIPLSTMLKDPDEGTRIAALQAIATLGPVAADAATAVKPLLEDADLRVDAADTLGRIGPAAQPVPGTLVKMLSDEQPSVRWSAVRAMSQIGGKEAHPAVTFMISAFPKATEVEGYNMMIYLALLGPVAIDALPTIQSTRIKNPVLPFATTWAINLNTLPWQSTGGGFGGRGGFGRGPAGGPGGQDPGASDNPNAAAAIPGGPNTARPGARMEGPRDQNGMAGGGPGGMEDPGQGPPGGGRGGRGGGRGGPGGGGPGNLMFPMMEAYVSELGSRLHPLATTLANKIMDRTAGDVPSYGYKILTADADASLTILTPFLKDADVAVRERATVAIGYMGPGALPAKSALQAALGKAPSDRERLLIQWSLREIESE